MADPNSAELLFFDTFQHDCCEDVNLDLVQFQRPVIISHIHVVPLGVKVQCDVPGGERLGATNPSSFKLDLFVNNLSKPNAATFENLGLLEYHSSRETSYKAEKELPTDGLILEGWYTMLTVAVFGRLTTIAKERCATPPPPPPPNQSRSKPMSVETSESQPSPADYRSPVTTPHSSEQEWGHATPTDPYRHESYLEPQRDPRLDPRGDPRLDPRLDPHHDSRHDPHLSNLEQPPHGTPPQPEQMVSYQQPDMMSRPPEPRAVPPPEPSHAVQPPEPPPPQMQQTLPPEPPHPLVQPPEPVYPSHHQPDPGYHTRSMPGDQAEPPAPMDRFDDHDSRDRDSRRYHRDRSSSRESDYRDYRSREGSHDSRDQRDYRGERSRGKEPDRDWGRGQDWDRRDNWDRDGDGYRRRERMDHDRRRPQSPHYSIRSPRRSPTPKRSSSRSRTRSPSRSRSRSRSYSRSRSPMSRGSSLSPGGISEDERGIPADALPEDQNDEIFDTLTPDLSGNEMSDGDLQVTEADDGGAYEVIVSDEEMMSDVDESEMQELQDMDDLWRISTYNPYQFELPSLVGFDDPALTSYQREKNNIKVDTMPVEAKAILDFIDLYTHEPHTSLWVEAMEDLPRHINVGLNYILEHQKRTDILKTLVKWVLEGIDMEKAVTQPANCYKLRHLKMGIKLTGTFCSTDEVIAKEMMMEEVQQKLFDLYQSDFMSSTMRIQILQSLQQSTRLNTGILWFLGHHDLQIGQLENKETCYQRLIKLLLTKQSVRTMVAITPLIRKMHIYEILGQFRQLVEKFGESIPIPDPEKVQAGDDAEDNVEETDNMITASINEAELEPIINCLQEIIRIHFGAKHIIAQPRRAIPALVQFMVNQDTYDPYPNLYHMFDSSQFLECLFMLVSSMSTINHPLVFPAVRDLLEQFNSSHHGLLYLASKPDITNNIIRALIQSGEYSRDDGSDDTPVHNLGLQLVYSLQALQYVGQLLDLTKKETFDQGADDPESLSVLYNIYNLTYNPAGKEGIIHFLSLHDNLNALIPFVELTGDEEKDIKIKKSLGASYASYLIVMVAMETKCVPMLEKFANTILNISDEEVTPKLTELQDLLTPCRGLKDYTCESLPHLLTHLKQYNEEITELPLGLVTTLRILQYLAISPKTPKEAPEELKYKYVLVEMFTADCMQIFINILQKVTDILLRPWQEGSYLTSNQGMTAVAIIKPTTAMLKHMLSYLIQARGSEFRDLTQLPVLFGIHTIMCSAPPTGVLSSDMIEIQQDVVDTLMAYTQPSLENTASEEGLNESLWTKMLRELMKYTMTAPYRFTSGLMLLSELLPLPLPIQSREALGVEEVIQATNARKLWSAHLLCCNTQLQDIIKTASYSSCPPLQQALRRVCWQIADLSAPTSQLVMKCLLEVLVDSFEFETQEEKTEEERKDDAVLPDSTIRLMKQSTPECALVLNCLANLMAQPPLKSAMLHLLRSGKTEDDILPKVLQLLNVVSEKPVHVQAQECMVSIIQSLCDLDVTLLPAENNNLQEQLTNALPDKEHLSMMCSALLVHVGNMDHNYASILLALRTLTMLTEHDYGIYLLKTSLDKNHGTFYNLFGRINNTFSKDSSDCLSTLSTATEFLRLLVSLDTDDDQPLLRTHVISVVELREILSWNLDMTPESEHPLHDLVNLLEYCSKEGESLESLLEGIQDLFLIMKTESNSDPKELVEPILPNPEPLPSQFSMRSLYILTDSEDDRLNVNYWLSCSPPDDSDQELELVRCDLEELSSKCCSDFDLKGELEKGTHPLNNSATKKKQRYRVRDQINTSGRGRSRDTFTAPMRGRGFSRGMNQNSRSDPFRSRPPNTSRPPSMHVDDFVKMEQGKGGGSSSAGGGAGSGGGGSRRQEKEFGRGRGRGFDRGRGNSSTRGRFFSPPGNYGGRRDGSSRGRGGTGSRGGQLSRGGTGGPRGQSMWGGRSKHTSSPRGFGRGRDDGRLGSGDRRGGRDSGSRFGRGGGQGSGRGRGHWLGPKAKDIDSRFMPPPSGGFGRGRRDQSRHMRSFTK